VGNRGRDSLNVEQLEGKWGKERGGVDQTPSI